MTDVIGAAAGVLTTVAFVPQVWKTWRSRSARDLSLGMLGTFAAGLALWIAYGVTLGAWPIVAANAVTLVLAGMLIVLKATDSSAAPRNAGAAAGR